MAVDERMLNAVERRVRSWRVPPLVADALLTFLVLAPIAWGRSWRDQIASQVHCYGWRWR